MCPCCSTGEIINPVGDWRQETLTDSQRDWAIHSEALWTTARAITRAHPNIDAGDVYHALRCLELSPAARLRQALSRGRLRAYAR